MLISEYQKVTILSGGEHYNRIFHLDINKYQRNSFFVAERCKIFHSSKNYFPIKRIFYDNEV